jgi:hypothetical protein
MRDIGVVTGQLVVVSGTTIAVMIAVPLSVEVRMPLVLGAGALLPALVPAIIAPLVRTDAAALTRHQVVTAARHVNRHLGWLALAASLGAVIAISSWGVVAIALIWLNASGDGVVQFVVERSVEGASAGAGIVAMWVLLARTARRRAIRSTGTTCSRCGYQLLSYQVRCPECGSDVRRHRPS